MTRVVSREEVDWFSGVKPDLKLDFARKRVNSQLRDLEQTPSSLESTKLPRTYCFRVHRLRA